MAQGTIWQLTCIQRVDDVRFTNVLYLRQNTNDPTGEPAEKAVADAIFQLFYTPMKPLLSENWQLLCIEVRPAFLTGIGAYRELYTLAGDNAVESLPSQLAVNATYNTVSGARGRTGRTYLGGFCTDQEKDNNLTKAARDALVPIVDVLAKPIVNQSAGTSYEAGPKPATVGDWLPWVQSDIRQPYTRIKNRRADLAC